MLGEKVKDEKAFAVELAPVVVPVSHLLTQLHLILLVDDGNQKIEQHNLDQKMINKQEDPNDNDHKL